MTSGLAWAWANFFQREYDTQANKLMEPEKVERVIDQEWVREQIAISEARLAHVPDAQREAMRAFIERSSRT